MPATIRKPSSQAFLDYVGPFEWRAPLEYLSARATPGLEIVRDQAYWRTVRVDHHVGIVGVSHDVERARLRVWHLASLATVRPQLLLSLRRLFDLDTDPRPIVDCLSRDARLAPLVRQRPGLRVPGTTSGFDLAVRAVLGQQVSVRGATTLAGRLAAAVGEPLPATLDLPPRVRMLGLSRVSPSPARLADAGVERIARIGLPRARAATLAHLSRAVAEGAIDLSPGPGAESAIERMLDLPGIGPWTAQYVALRALRLPDAFPESDLGLRKAMGGVSATELRRAAERWRPWRGYAAIHLWVSSGIPAMER